MARRELGAHALLVAQAVRRGVAGLEGEVVVGCSGGTDSLALAMGAAWAAPREGLRARAVIVDHGLQEGSAEVARATADLLAGRGLPAEVRRAYVEDSGAGMEAAAREARLALLAADGRPVLLGHTLDDQAESVLLGLLRGSGTRSLAGMAERRGPFLRPLLGLRREDTRRACDEWGLEPWHDPHNTEPRFARARARAHLAELSRALGRDVAPALARTAALARLDADALDRLAEEALAGVDLSGPLEVSAVEGLDEALRLRAIKRWLESGGVAEIGWAHLRGVDELIRGWRGQGPVAVPGAVVARSAGRLAIVAGPRRPDRDVE